MKLNILHLYPELMSLYGEYANLAILRRRLEALGVSTEILSINCEETPNFTDVDLIYMGAGTERSQKFALQCLLPHATALVKSIERGTLVLFTGNAMPLLGKSITDANGKIYEALSIADFSTTESDKRTGVDVIAQSSLLREPVVGFMNKCSVTHGITSPLFTTLQLGFGNENEHSAEGYVNGNVFASHITGPLLVKNPGVTDLMISRLFAQKDWTFPASLPRLPHEQEAYEVTLRELQQRIK